MLVRVAHLLGSWEDVIVRPRSGHCFRREWLDETDARSEEFTGSHGDCLLGDFDARRNFSLVGFKQGSSIKIAPIGGGGVNSTLRITGEGIRCP